MHRMFPLPATSRSPAIWRTDPFLAVTAALVPLRDQILSHALYDLIGRPQGLTVFAEHQGFDVWDDYLLQEATLGAGSRPARPSLAERLARCRQAMAACGAETATLDRLERLLAAGTSWPAALDAACVPSAAATLLSRTWALCQDRSPLALAATLLFGRERLQPDLARRLTGSLDAVGRSAAATLLTVRRPTVAPAMPNDGLARALADQCGQDPEAWQQVYLAACGALQARLAFWDGITAAIRRRQRGEPPRAAGGPSLRPLRYSACRNW